MRASLQEVTSKQEALLDRIPTVQDTQAAWLLLLFCASSRSNYVTRVVDPEASRDYAWRQDTLLWNCLCRVMGIVLVSGGPTAREIAGLSLSSGGLGIRNAERGRKAAYWASWADSLEMLKHRHPASWKAFWQS